MEARNELLISAEIANPGNPLVKEADFQKHAGGLDLHAGTCDTGAVNSRHAVSDVN